MDDSVIELDDSPVPSATARKRKREMQSSEEVSSSPSHPLLDSVMNRFQNNKQERDEWEAVQQSKREMEQVHSEFIKKNVACPVEMAKADYVVGHWAKINRLQKQSEKSQRKEKSRRKELSRKQAANSRRKELIRIISSQAKSNQSPTISVSTAKSTSSLSNPSFNQSPTISVSTANQKQHNNQSAHSTFSAANQTKQDNRTSTQTYQQYNMGNMSSVANSDRENNESRKSVNNDTINLDSTNDDSVTFESSFNNDSIHLDSSNNSNTSISENTETSKEHVCCVLNCNAEFTSEGALGQHMNLFQHSPCNPCLKAKDCKLPADPLCYMCPTCDREFQAKADCCEHMKTENHSPYLPPLSITGYLCAQCLHVFESFAACWEHIEHMSHHDICYPFADDHKSHEGGLGPVAVAEELVQDLLTKSKQVAYRVQCLECSMDMTNPAILRHHRLETNNQHIVSALADTNLVDVFAGYLAGYTCDTCSRLFNGELKELAKHQCALGITGTIVESDVCSFVDFVKRCALTLVKSLEQETGAAPKSPRPGTSRDISRARGDQDVQHGACAATGLPKIRKHSQFKHSTKTQISDSDCVNDDSVTGKQTKDDITKTRKTIEIPISDLPSNGGAIRKKPKLNQHASETTADTNSCHPDIEKLFAHGGENNSNTIIPSDIETNKSTEPQHTVPLSMQNIQPQHQDFQQTMSRFSSNIMTQGFNALTQGLFQPQVQQPSSALQANLSFEDNPTIPAPYNPNPQRRNPSSPGNSRYLLRDQYKLPDLPPLPPDLLLNADDLTGSKLIMSPPETHTSNFDRACTSTSQKKPRHTSAPPGPSTSQTRLRQTSGPPAAEQYTEHLSKRDRSRSPLDTNPSPTSTENLLRMRNIIFLDLDNWPGFFSKLPRCLPDLTFVWGFYGGKIQWREPLGCYIFKQMKQKGCFFLNERCGETKDAADFAIVLTVGKMDERLPTSIAFTIMSGDKGFCEVERQMKGSERKAVVINPHSAQQFSNDMIYAMVTSVTDT